MTSNAELVLGFKTKCKSKLSERDIAALDLTKSKVTSNEFNAASKNYFEEKRLIKRTNELNREARRAIDLQDKSLEILQHSIRNVYKSTGCTHRLVKSAHHSSLRTKLSQTKIIYDAFEHEHDKDEVVSVDENDDDDNDDDDDEYHVPKTQFLKQRPKSSTIPFNQKQSQNKRFYSASQTLDTTRPKTAKPSIETTASIKIRKNPGLKVTIDSSESDEDCLAQWNKFKKEKLKHQMQHELQFLDVKMEKMYCDLREAREKIPHVNEQKIVEQKLKDPIFAKRYKQYKSAKLINKPPDFDPNDINIKIRLPKTIMQREKMIIIQQAVTDRDLFNRKYSEQQRMYDNKIKEFLSKLP